MLHGLIAAPHSPFTSDGELNLEAVEAYARHLVSDGVGGAFICGSTGEGYSLTVEERKRLVACWCEAAAGRLRVIVHVGSLCLADSRELATYADRVGADAIASAPPFHFRPERAEDLVHWLAAIAEAAPSRPLYYYHVPSVTGVRLDVAELLSLGGRCIPTLAGAKFTDPDLAAFARCVRLEGGRFNLLYGCDEMLLSALAAGAQGAVGSTYSYAAPLYHRVIAAFGAGDMEQARRWQARAIELIGLLDRFRFFPASKALLAMVGVDCGPVRPPLRPLSAEEQVSLRHEVEALGFFAWLEEAAQG